MMATISDLHWYSDWNGDEVGFPEVPVVGLYYSPSLNVDVYLNTDDGEVLRVFGRDEEDEAR
jgi:hypothetical protein